LSNIHKGFYMSKQTASLHIVRRYGKVGGMERYVWELTHALSQQNQTVTILCEEAFDTPSSAIKVIELGTIKPKPRWISMLRFSANVSNFIKQHPEIKNSHIIHSHERTAVHQVTTFHGPPIKNRKKSIFDCLTPRLLAWDYLEERELCATQVQRILPNSTLISDQLIKHYPKAARRMQAPAYPGVSDSFFSIPKKTPGKTVGFIGTEWKRKGLEFAVTIIEKRIQNDDEIHLIVAGPNPNEIQHLFSSWPAKNYSLIGWIKTEDFLSQIDLLIHPAHTEPFGMVIAEANAAGKPVIISKNCGIKSLITQEMGEVIPLEDKNRWDLAIDTYLKKAPTSSKLNLTWTALAIQHIHLYMDIKPS